MAKKLIASLLMALCFWVKFDGTARCEDAQKSHYAKMFKELKESQDPIQKEKIAQELIQSTPTTKEDVAFLAEQLDGDMSPFIQRIIIKIKDPALVPDLIRVIEQKSRGMKKLTQKDFDTMTEKETEKEAHQMVNVGVWIEILGNLKDKRAIPILKKFLDYETLSYTASTALGKIGDEQTLDELMLRLKTQEELNLSGFGHAATSRILQRLSDPTLGDEEKANLLNQFGGATRPEDKPLLKQLVMTHKDPRVRDKAGLALMHQIRKKPEAADTNTIIEWVIKANDTRDESEVWGISAMGFSWNPTYIPVLIKVLTNRESFSSSRQSAAELLADHMVVEATPYLEDILRTEIRSYSDDTVLVAACFALRKITGKPYFVEVYESDFREDSPDLQSIKLGELPHYKLIGEKRP